MNICQVKLIAEVRLFPPRSVGLLAWGGEAVWVLICSWRTSLSTPFLFFFFFLFVILFFFLFPLSSQLFILTHIHYGNDIFPALGEQDSASQVAEQKFSSLSFPWEWSTIEIVYWDWSIDHFSCSPWLEVGGEGSWGCSLWKTMFS